MDVQIRFVPWMMIADSAIAESVESGVTHATLTLDDGRTYEGSVVIDESSKDGGKA